MNISFRTYGKYSSDNYGVNALRLDIGEISLWFSYKTVIAFRDGFDGDVIVSENCWSVVTGKHLNFIDGGSKKSRLKRSEFESKLREMLERHNINV